MKTYFKDLYMIKYVAIRQEPYLQIHILQLIEGVIKIIFNHTNYENFYLVHHYYYT